MNEFTLSFPDKTQMNYLADLAAVQGNPILYCNELFARKLIATVTPVSSKSEYIHEIGYIGMYTGIPIYITQTFLNNKPYAVIVPQFIKEKGE